MIDTLAQCVINERDTNHVGRLLQLAASARDWQQQAILDGIGARVTPGHTRQPKAKPILFASKPRGLAALESRGELADALARISPLIVWPGKPGYVAPPPLRALNSKEEQRFEMGRQLYSATCIACHQPSGLGQQGTAPPLVDSEWVLGSEQRLVRIVLQGAEGPIHAAGVTFDSEMPSWASFNDQQIAGLLTYIRRNWENGGEPISPEVVAEIRAKSATRHNAWTEAELSQIH